MMMITRATTTRAPLLLSSSSPSGVVIPSACRPVRKSLALVIASTVCVVAGLVLVLCVTVLCVTPTVKSAVVTCHVEELVIRGESDDNDDTGVTSSSTSRTQFTRYLSPSVTTLTSFSSSLTSSTSAAYNASLQTSLSSFDITNLSLVGLVKESVLCGLGQPPEALTAEHPACLEIKVRYSLPDGSFRFGFLHRARYGNETVAEVDENMVCYCEDCCTAASFSTGSVIPRSISTATTIETQSITSGDTLECFLRRHPGTAKTETELRNRTRGVSVSMLNAMFWPTLLFVVGVVGLFFGWINLAQDRYTKFSHQRRTTGTHLRSTNLTDIV